MTIHHDAAVIRSAFLLLFLFDLFFLFLSSRLSPSVQTDLHRDSDRDSSPSQGFRSFDSDLLWTVWWVFTSNAIFPPSSSSSFSSSPLHLLFPFFCRRKKFGRLSPRKYLPINKITQNLWEKKNVGEKKERKCAVLCRVHCGQWRERNVDRPAPAGRGNVTYIPLLLSPMEWKGRTTSGGYSFSFFFLIFVAQVQFWDGGDAGRSRRGTRISKWPLGFKE